MNAPSQYFARGIGPLFACFLTVGFVACIQHNYHHGNASKPGAVVHHASNSHVEPVEIPPACTPAWNQLVDSRLGISDSSGHGPDIGSEEWLSAVGRKSGVIDDSGHGPDAGSAEWCAAVDFKVFGRR